MQHIEFKWRASDRLELFAQDWQPEGEPRAVVCLAHGHGEHSGRYAHVAAVLNEAGYALLAFDLRGHGRSEGQRGHAPSFDVLLDDISHLLEEAAQRFPDRPRFLYGHSLGGLLVLSHALRRTPQLRGLIATGPAMSLAFAPAAWKPIVGRILYNVWPTLQLATGLETQALSRDPAVVHAYEADPLVHDRTSARTGIDTLDAGEWVLEHASELALPLLIMHGAADRLTSAEASRQFAEAVRGDCTFKLWDGLYHEIHNEPEQSQVFDVMLTWLEAHTS